MKLKSLITVGILSLLPYLQAQDVSSSTNPPSLSTNPPAQTEPRTGTYVGHFGIGVQLGEPFGVNAKYWLNDCVALDAAAGWSPQDHSAAEIHADVLFHDFDLLKPPHGRLPVYIGGGVFERFRDNNHGDLAGLRVPIGVSYMFDNCPVDVFAEFSPELIVAPFARGGISAAIGARFWF
jgi:hypothetical protein